MILLLFKIAVTLLVIAFILAYVADFVGPSRVESRIKMAASVFLNLFILFGTACLIAALWSI
jgi:hypothetical protein